MSNDNRTLADVQPRGRVRLGDALPPLPASSVQCLTTGALLFSVEKMKLYALAALSAQPSPGGQDALDCIGRIEEAIEFRVPHDIYAAVHGELAELKAALAARQPVGEPVGRVRTRVDGGFIAELLPGVADRLSNMAPLYLHQPAQAVDLCAAIKAAFPLLTDYGLHHSHCCEYKLIDERHRLHNLIDSQAVGNG